MTYLRNAWYAAAWSQELSVAPLGRTFLEEPVVLFRDELGRAVALADVCPHRFAPLSQGKLIGGSLQCPYHGLRFGPEGNCTHNPHGPIPKTNKNIRSYPLVERYGVLWIWMGATELADESQIPNFEVINDPEHYGIVKDYLHLKVNYQLGTDNLLDLSHAQFLHPMIGNPDSSDRNRFHSKVEGNTVWAFNDMPEEPITKLWKLLWDTELTVGDRRAYMRWDPPANMFLDVGYAPCGRPKEEGATQYSAHLLTPETAQTTHYFWAVARNVQIDNETVNQQLRANINKAFSQEDEPMMSACQVRMRGSLDLIALKPLVLRTDVAAMKARMMLDGLIKKERGEA